MSAPIHRIAPLLILALAVLSSGVHAEGRSLRNDVVFEEDTSGEGRLIVDGEIYDGARLLTTLTAALRDGTPVKVRVIGVAFDVAKPNSSKPVGPAGARATRHSPHWVAVGIAHQKDGNLLQTALDLVGAQRFEYKTTALELPRERVGALIMHGNAGPLDHGYPILQTQSGKGFVLTPDNTAEIIRQLMSLAEGSGSYGIINTACYSGSCGSGGRTFNEELARWLRGKHVPGRAPLILTAGPGEIESSLYSGFQQVGASSRSKFAAALTFVQVAPPPGAPLAPSPQPVGKGRPEDATIIITNDLELARSVVRYPPPANRCEIVREITP